MVGIPAIAVVASLATTVVMAVREPQIIAAIADRIHRTAVAPQAETARAVIPVQTIVAVQVVTLIRAVVILIMTLVTAVTDLRTGLTILSGTKMETGSK